MGQLNEICCGSKVDRKQNSGTDTQEKMIFDNISKMHDSRNLMLSPTRTKSIMSTKSINQKVSFAIGEGNRSYSHKTGSFGIASDRYNQLLTPSLEREGFFKEFEESKLNKMLTPTSTAEQTAAIRYRRRMTIQPHI